MTLLLAQPNAIPPAVNWTHKNKMTMPSWHKYGGIGPVRIVSTFRGGRQKECIHHIRLTADCLGCFIKCMFQYCVWRTAL